MRIYIDLDTLNLIEGPNIRRTVSRISQKRGDAAQFDIVFVRSGLPVRLDGTVVITFAAKLDGEFDSDPVVFHQTFAASEVTDPDTDPHYSGAPSFNTAALNTAIRVDEDPENDLRLIDLMGEISWTVDGGLPSTTQTFTVRVNNDVYRGDEGTPVELPTPDDWLDARAVRFDEVQTLTALQQRQAQANLGLPLNNFAATDPPSVTDDSSLGYGVGSLWIDVAGQEAYRCLAATAGAADWQQTTLDGAELAFVLSAYASTGDLFDVNQGLQSQIDQKAAASHTHTADDITDAGTAGIAALQAETPADLREAAESEGRAADVQTHLGNLTLALDHLGTYTRITSLSAGTITIPAQATVAWPAGARLTIENEGPGDLTATLPFGVFLDGPALVVPGETLELVRKAEDLWTSTVRRLSDADAAAYVARVGLSPDSSAARRINGWMSAMRRAGVPLLHVFLGNSEFAGRSGTTQRALIGADGTVNGTVPADADGLAFTNNAANFIEFSNPARSTATYVGMFAAFKATTLADSMLIAAGPLQPGIATNHGPILRATVASGALRANFWIAGTNPQFPTNSNTGQTGAVVGVTQMFGGQLLASGNSVQTFVGADYYSPASNFTSDTIWNDNATWRIGVGANNSTPAQGKIQLTIATSAELTRDQIRILHAATAKFRIAELSPIQVALVGDSMTVSATGGANFAISRSPQLFAILNSGWRGAGWGQLAVGGQNVLTQETYFSSMIRQLKSTGLPRYMFFWPGYNATAPGLTLNSQADAQALADRYLAMASQARALGIQSVFWSRTRSNTETSADWIANVAFFNDYLKAQSAIHGYVFYDHRVTYPTQFDGATRDPAFTGDGLHFSQAGVEALCADFVAQFPNPTNPFI